MSDWNERNKSVIEEFRANAGKVGDDSGDPRLLLLGTTGARSGLPRTNPLLCLPDGERFMVIASKGGAPTHPDWYHNIVANPDVSVEVGAEQFQALATAAEEPERTKLYEKMASLKPFFSEYQDKAAPRIIPVIILTRKP